MESIDTDRNGSINYTEFIASCLENATIIKEDNIMSAFRMLDTDGDGKITRDELKQLLERTFVLIQARKLR
jgi:calcium-dependent protein kinase